jgi:deoxyribodipyrimidine photolyase-related protein
MNLAGLEPQEAYRRFMELFVEAYDGVMVANAVGMGPTSQGGIFTLADRFIEQLIRAA